ncbi:hypothetical protein [Streptomyces abikoensis]
MFPTGVGEGNPDSNNLKAGVTEDSLIDAIEKSGYPLQSTVFELIRQDFTVQQEWGFRDRRTGDIRAVDLLASRDLGHIPPGQSRVRPSLKMLIECKQSELPYVFFGPSPAPGDLKLPTLCGLKPGQIELTTDDSKSKWLYEPTQALLGGEEFLTMEGFSILSKCARKGKSLELTGTEAYNGIVMPLTSAALHFLDASEPGEAAHWYDAHLVCAIAVVDAPMAVAHTGNGRTYLEMRPWCRIFRHEPAPRGTFMGHRGRHLSIDVVHKDHFEAYLHHHLLPFWEVFADRALQHHEVLATKKGFVSGLRKDPSDLLNRLKPR